MHETGYHGFRRFAASEKAKDMSRHQSRQRANPKMGMNETQVRTHHRWKDYLDYRAVLFQFASFILTFEFVPQFEQKLWPSIPSLGHFTDKSII
jgi:hypothetical protein